MGVKDPVLDIAKQLEEIALKDEYFVERKLYPNVDFYSGIIYRAIGIPTRMFTVMFALGRLARLDRTMEGNDREQGADRSSAPDLHRAYQARLRCVEGPELKGEMPRTIHWIVVGLKDVTSPTANTATSP